jgi:hypothetical protein
MLNNFIFFCLKMAHELCFENGTWFCCHRTQNWQFLYHSHSGTARHFNTGHSSIILFTIVHEKEGASRNCHDYQTRQIIFCSFRRYDLLCFLGGACCHWWMLAYTHIRTNTHTHTRKHMHIQGTTLSASRLQEAATWHVTGANALLHVLRSTARTGMRCAQSSWH